MITISNKAKKLQHQVVCATLRNGHFIVINRDQYGKFYVKINGIMKEKGLTAEEIVRYLVEWMRKL